ncbi:hypothetical protein [Gracilimonas halophila]|uniref:Uncharacterized protein n=1 Tax=Gracilimonas halophila TaxID=1834464 RepID=A0ABW5JIA7_9BACT
MMDWNSSLIQAGQHEYVNIYTTQPDGVMAGFDFVIYVLAALTCLLTLLNIYFLIKDHKLNKKIKQELETGRQMYVPTLAHLPSGTATTPQSIGFTDASQPGIGRCERPIDPAIYHLLNTYINHIDSRQN